MAPTTHFGGSDFLRKGQCTSIFLICKREETVGKLGNENGSLFEADMEHPFLYTIEDIFGNKVNSTIRMYAIKMVFFFSFYFPLYRQDLLPFTSSELLRLHPLFRYLLRKKLLIDLEDAFVRFILFRARSSC